MDTNQQLDAPVIRQAVVQRRLKAFLVSSMATFLMLCVIWSLTASKYVAQNKIGLGLINNPNIDYQKSKEILVQLVQESWEATTSEQSIREHLLKLKGIVSKDAIQNADFDVQIIRDSICYELKELNGRFQIATFLNGRGTSDEKRLIDRIAVKLASDLALVPIRQLADLQLQPDHANDLAQRLSRPIETVRQAQQLADDVAANLEEVNSPNNMADRQSIQFAESLNKRKDELLDELEILKQEERRVAGLDPLQPSVAKVQRQMFAAKDELAIIESRLFEFENDLAPQGNSPFRTASFSNAQKGNNASIYTTDVSELNGYLKSIDNELVQIQQKAENQKPGLKLPSVPVIVQSFEKASIRPRNGINMIGPFVSLTMLALAFGSIVAWKLKPLAEDVGFTSKRKVADLLRLPIVAQLSRQSSDKPEFEPEAPLANLTVKASELIVLTALAMVACMLLFSPSIRAAFLDNPLHGVSEILWKIQGK